MTAKRRFQTASPLGPMAGTPGPLDGPTGTQTQDPAPVVPLTPAPPRTPASGQPGAAVAAPVPVDAYPAPPRVVPRPAGAGMTPEDRRYWRHALGAGAGKLAAAYAAAAAAEDAWRRLVERAAAEDVPADMVTAALTERSLGA